MSSGTQGNVWRAGEGVCTDTLNTLRINTEDHHRIGLFTSQVLGEVLEALGPDALRCPDETWNREDEAYSVEGALSTAES